MIFVQTDLFDLFGLYTPLRMLIVVAVVCTIYCKRASLAESRLAERHILHILYCTSNAVDESSQRSIL